MIFRACLTRFECSIRFVFLISEYAFMSSSLLYSPTLTHDVFSRERLQAERKAREAAEAAQRQMLQRHLQVNIKSPLANGKSDLQLQLLPSASSIEGQGQGQGQPVSLGYSLENVSEITAMNHNLLTGQKNSYEAKVNELQEQLKSKEQELDKARLSLKRQEHQNAKLIEQNEDMMESIGVYEMEKSTPGPEAKVKPNQSPSTQNGNHLHLEPLSVLANSETALSYAVFRSISSSFDDFYVHLESTLSEVVTSSGETPAAQQSPERKHFMKNILLLSKERCKLCIETSVNKVLLEILEDDRPVVINGQAHSSHALFEKVSKELTRLRAEVETWKERSTSNAQSNKLFEALTLEFEQCQKDREELKAECLALKGKILLAANKDGQAKLVERVKCLQEENKNLLSQQATSNKLKKILEKKISEFVEKEVSWEKDLNKFKKKLKMKAESRRATSASTSRAREHTEEQNSERDIALRNMLLERVNKSIAAVKVAKESDLESLIASEEKKDPTFENWQAIFEFNQRLSQDGSPSAMTTPSTASPPIRTKPVSMATPLTMPAMSPLISTPPVMATSTSTTAAAAAAATTQPSGGSSSPGLDFLENGTGGGFSSSTKDALFRLNKMGKPSWQAQAAQMSADTGYAPSQSDVFRQKLPGMTGDSQFKRNTNTNTNTNTPKGYLPFVRHTDEALDYAIKNTAAGIHRRMSQARMTREEMIHRQVYPSSKGSSSGRANIVPPSPGLSAIPSSEEFSSNLASTDQHISELSRLKKECERYKRQMFKAEKEAIRARSDLNEVVDELMEVKSTKTPQPKRETSKRRGPKHQRNH